jgi:4-hydroxy-2-oxoheptanedioate aldolase
MIEKKEAMENLEEILAVPGVDMVQFGPGDYAMSTGLHRLKDIDQILEAEAVMIRAALARGIQPRAEIRDSSGAERYLAMGVHHFCVGHDVQILHDWWTREGAVMREALSNGATRSTPVDANVADKMTAAY